MDSEIIGFTDWLQTPPGGYLLAWEQTQFDQAVGDIFGYHALQLGFTELNALRANRMPHQWLAAADIPADDSLATPPGSASSPLRAALVTDAGALPFPAASLDLVVLPHTLELSDDAHATLREVERVLVPEGRLVISGLNPASLWGMRQRRAHFYQRFGRGDLFLPEAGDFIGYWRLRDWLRLLSFEVESSSFGCYRPAVRSAAWLERLAWMDTLGSRYWPILGAAYCITAVKKVRGMRVLGASWKKSPRRATAPVAVAAPRAHSQADRRDV